MHDDATPCCGTEEMAGTPGKCVFLARKRVLSK
jgi:hypothetical protein